MGYSCTVFVVALENPIGEMTIETNGIAIGRNRIHTFGLADNLIVLRTLLG